MKIRRLSAAAPPPVPVSGAGVQVQILATEHWSLLASRSTTQSEILVRITMFLTLVSASVVSLALVGQIIGFTSVFAWFSVGLLAIVSIVGTLTAVRVANGSVEDFAYVLGMNRLRAAYATLDPSVQQYFVTSIHDDFAGITHTYNPVEKSTPSQFLGSSGLFVLVVDSAVFGVLAAALLVALGAVTPLSVVIGLACGIVYLAVAITIGGRRFNRILRSLTPSSPTPRP
jgi:hypothetical protein